MNRIGFMQGRLSPKPADRIQAFPKDSWREEFPRGREIGFDVIELIYDTLHYEQNPLVTEAGRRELRELAAQSGVAIGSICADYFMQKLLGDVNAQAAAANLEQAKELLHISKEVGCPLVEFPFVDSSSLKVQNREAIGHALRSLSSLAAELGLQLAMETDLPPVEFKAFLDPLPALVGANLDMGNSAALGFDALAECRAFGPRIKNVHVKDRVLGGTTVPLTTGHTDFPRVFRGLAQTGFRGDYVLQTAPSPDYLGAAANYRRMVQDWLRANGT